MERIAKVWLAVLEVVAALLLALLVSGAFAIVFAPWTNQVEFSLLRSADEPQAPSQEIRQIVSGTVQADRIEVVPGSDGDAQVILTGLTFTDQADASVRESLTSMGYTVVGVDIRRPLPDLEKALDSPRLILSLQALVFVMVGWGMASVRIRPAASGPEPSRQFLGTLGWGVAGGVAALIVSAAAGAIMTLLGFEVREQEVLLELLSDREKLIRIAPWVVLIVPFSEEVFFRYYALRFLSRRGGVLVGLVISSLLFATVHLNPSGIPAYFGIGMVLAWVYRRSGSFLVPVIAHAVNNAVALAITWFVPVP